uniref:Uncharacterized protein n=1 Tax=Anguilla anguilla TaxID=7936 RepID=A0A0E9QC23_ANGAN
MVFHFLEHHFPPVCMRHKSLNDYLTFCLVFQTAVLFRWSSAVQDCVQEKLQLAALTGISPNSAVYFSGCVKLINYISKLVHNLAPNQILFSICICYSTICNHYSLPLKFL